MNLEGWELSKVKLQDTLEMIGKLQRMSPTDQGILMFFLGSFIILSTSNEDDKKSTLYIKKHFVHVSTFLCTFM